MKSINKGQMKPYPQQDPIAPVFCPVLHTDNQEPCRVFEERRIIDSHKKTWCRAAGGICAQQDFTIVKCLNKNSVVWIPDIKQFVKYLAASTAGTVIYLWYQGNCHRAVALPASTCRPQQGPFVQGQRIASWLKDSPAISLYLPSNGFGQHCACLPSSWLFLIWHPVKPPALPTSGSLIWNFLTQTPI